MVSKHNTVERAFELARSGRVSTLTELRRQLSREGHEAVEAHLAGAAIRKQLAQIFAAAAVQPPNPAV
jgi:hypothetical protein